MVENFRVYLTFSTNLCNSGKSEPQYDLCSINDSIFFLLSSITYRKQQQCGWRMGASAFKLMPILMDPTRGEETFGKKKVQTPKSCSHVWKQAGVLK